MSGDEKKVRIQEVESFVKLALDKLDSVWNDLSEDVSKPICDLLDDAGTLLEHAGGKLHAAAKQAGA